MSDYSTSQKESQRGGLSSLQQIRGVGPWEIESNKNFDLFCCEIDCPDQPFFKNGIDDPQKQSISSSTIFSNSKKRKDGFILDNRKIKKSNQSPQPQSISKEKEEINTTSQDLSPEKSKLTRTSATTQVTLIPAIQDLRLIGRTNAELVSRYLEIYQSATAPKSNKFLKNFKGNDQNINLQNHSNFPSSDAPQVSKKEESSIQKIENSILEINRLSIIRNSQRRRSPFAQSTQEIPQIKTQYLQKSQEKKNIRIEQSPSQHLDLRRSKILHQIEEQFDKKQFNPYTFQEDYTSYQENRQQVNNMFHTSSTIESTKNYEINAPSMRISKMQSHQEKNSPVSIFKQSTSAIFQGRSDTEIQFEGTHLIQKIKALKALRALSKQKNIQLNSNMKIEMKDSSEGTESIFSDKANFQNQETSPLKRISKIACSPFDSSGLKNKLPEPSISSLPSAMILPANSQMSSADIHSLKSTATQHCQDEKQEQNKDRSPSKEMSCQTIFESEKQKYVMLKGNLKLLKGINKNDRSKSLQNDIYLKKIDQNHAQDNTYSRNCSPSLKILRDSQDDITSYTTPVKSSNDKLPIFRELPKNGILQFPKLIFQQEASWIKTKGQREALSNLARPILESLQKKEVSQGISLSSQSSPTKRETKDLFAKSLINPKFFIEGKTADLTKF